MDIESKPQESPPDTPPIPVYLLTCADQGDEVSLVDIWKILYRRKKIILLGLIVSFILAAIYNFSVEPVYRAKTYLLPPQQKDIQGLLIDGVDTKQYTPDSVYKLFRKNLGSQGVRREFFDTYNLADHYLRGRTDPNLNKLFNENFNKSLQILEDEGDFHFVSVTFDDVDPELAAKRLNQFIDFVSGRTIQQLYGEIDTIVRAEIEDMHYKIANKLKLARVKRRDNITNLREAARMARKLGIQNAEMFPQVSDKTGAGVAVNVGELPLYMRGVKALEVNISELDARKSDEAFIAGFRELEERLAFLEGISIDTGSLSGATIDMRAVVPYEVERPRKVRTFLLSVVLGFIVGIFAALISEFVSKVSRVSTDYSEKRS